jgi:hypothetical protein
MTSTRMTCLRKTGEGEEAMMFLDRRIWSTQYTVYFVYEICSSVVQSARGFVAGVAFHAKQNPTIGNGCKNGNQTLHIIRKQRQSEV